MRILGLDGALGGFSAAVVSDGALLSAIEASGNVALERGLTIVRHVLDAAGMQTSDLGRIAVGNGPGRFTGLRIAVSYAKTFALAWQLPLVPVSSFDVLEAGYVGVDPCLSIVEGRAGVISARRRDGGVEMRASGRTADVLDQLFSGPAPAGTLSIFAAPEDVLRGLAERDIHVNVLEPPLAPPAAAVATIAASREPVRSLHAVVADYGELPPARVPNFGQ